MRGFACRVRRARAPHAAPSHELSTTPKVVNGLFGVDKTDGMLRLIIDARRANACFVEPPAAQLPTPDITAQLQVPEGHRLFVTRLDLDNFYHRLRLPPWLRPYFALPPLRADELSPMLPLPPATLVYPCCCTLPMGWSHSVYLAQAVHEHLLDKHTPLSAADRLTAASDKRVDRLRHQVYIDDLILFELDGDVRSRAAMASYTAAVSAAGHAVKASKIHGPSADGVECLGLLVHGGDLTVGLAPERLHQLCSATVAMLRRGTASGHDMQRLVGHWTWAALACRPAFSVFCAVYRFIAAAGYRTFTIWPSVRRELWAIVGLAPLLHSSLAQPWLDRVVATDASGSGEGVVVTSLEPAVVAAVASAPRSRIAPSAVPPPLASAAWSPVVSAPWRRPEHINSLELRAVTTAVRWLISSPRSPAHQVLILCDSSTAVGSISKGRSSSPLLLRRLRVLAALCLAAGLRLHLFWIRSADNPADEPSRAFG